MTNRNPNGGIGIHIPKEITEEILSRLPVKSLLRFKCVSKSIYRLISSKSFIKFHLNRTLSNHTGNFLEHNCTYCPQRFMLPSLLRSNFDRITFVNSCNATLCLCCVNRDRITVVNSCNGLCCVKAGGKLFFWNPATRELSQLPDLNVTLKHDYFYGFGFDESNDDYKLIIGHRKDLVLSVHLYSMRTNSWKRISDIDDAYVLHVHFIGKFVNGRLHWTGNSGNQWKILSFDLTTEVFGFVELPALVTFKNPFFIYEVDGYLAVFRLNAHPHVQLHIWVMKQYGLISSWCLIPINRLDPIYNISTQELVHLLPNGEILCYYGTSDSELLLYNTTNSSFTHIPIKCRGLCLKDRVGAIIESLVSPKSGSDTI